jgi:hypothetical protein
MGDKRVKIVHKCSGSETKTLINLPIKSYQLNLKKYILIVKLKKEKIR